LDSWRWRSLLAAVLVHTADSIPAALQQQSLLNAVAAIFAAGAAGCQAVVFYLQISD
jgi:hypothetical protein